jgi:ribonucleoside-diphosphate reductase alpha chain
VAKKHGGYQSAMILSKDANKITSRRYYHDCEDWDRLSLRVGKAASLNEENKVHWIDMFASQISDLNFIPAGRILRNTGRLKQSCLNCAVLPIGDSIEQIGSALCNALVLWKYGAGIGIDFSPLREKSAALVTSGGKSSGMLSFLEIFDCAGRRIETGGQRRSGCLAALKVSHPEIEEFIHAKDIDGVLSSFNMSVMIDSAFLNAVEEGDNWPLTFAGRHVSTVKAVKLWEDMLYSMIKGGEPGIINADNLKENNSHYFQPISCVNLCGEVPLPAFGACCLGSIVLTSFISGKSTNWKKMRHTIKTAVRFLDNILDINYYPIQRMEVVTKNSRRIGLGVMGLHDYLMAKEIRYGSNKSIGEIEKLFRFIRDTAYQSSVELAIEKGAFPGYSRSQYNAASFVRKLPAKLRMYIKDNAIRNCCLLTAPPVGTTSLVVGCSSGIEPVPRLAYRRKDRVSERVYIHPKMREFLNSGKKKRPDWLIDSYDLCPEDHFEVQAIVQKYLDSSVSKTINCPKGTTVSDLSKLLLEYINDLVGVTVYVDGTKANQPIVGMSTEEAIENIDKAATAMPGEAGECRGGSCDL